MDRSTTALQPPGPHNLRNMCSARTADNGLKQAMFSETITALVLMRAANGFSARIAASGMLMEKVTTALQPPGPRNPRNRCSVRTAVNGLSQAMSSETMFAAQRRKTGRMRAAKRSSAMIVVSGIRMVTFTIVRQSITGTLIRAPETTTRRIPNAVPMKVAAPLRTKVRLTKMNKRPPQNSVRIPADRNV